MADNTATCPWFLMIGLKQHDGTPLLKGSIMAYDAGTTYIKVIYTDRAMTSPAAQPIDIATSGNGGVLQLFGLGNYKFVIKDIDGGVVQTIDNVYLGRNSAATAEQSLLSILAFGTVDALGEVMTTGSITFYDTGTTDLADLGSLANPYDFAAWEPEYVTVAYATGDYDIVIKDEDGATIRTLSTVFVGQTLGGG